MKIFPFVLAATVCVLAGCASSGVKVDQSKLGTLQPGVTTYDQAVATLGKPTNSTMLSDGTRSIQYIYMHVQADAASFIPIVGIFAGGANSETTTLTVSFDKAGRLTTYGSTQGTNSVGTGLISGQSR